MHSIQTFAGAFAEISIVLVLPEGQFEYWHELSEKYEFNIPYQLVKGGSTRFESVKNGLSYVNEDGIIAGFRAIQRYPGCSECCK